MEKESNTQPEAEKGGFVPPASQEALDKIIQERVARATENTEQRLKQDYEGYLPPAEAEALRGEVKKRDAQIADFERESIAVDAGLPKGFGVRLRGESAEEWSADAQTLAGALTQAAGGSAEVKPEVEQQPKPKRGTGGGAPDVLAGLTGKSPSELVKNIPRI